MNDHTVYVTISPPTRETLMDWAQDVLAETDAADEKAASARRAYRVLEAGCDLAMTHDEANTLLHAMWSVRLEGTADAANIRKAAYPPYTAHLVGQVEAPAMDSVALYREQVAAVIDAVLTLGPANEPDTVRCWAEERLNTAMNMLLDDISEEASRCGS